jgi:hypothetical protein
MLSRARCSLEVIQKIEAPDVRSDRKNELPRQEFENLTAASTRRQCCDGR